MTYTILQFVGALSPGQTVPDTDFPPDTDFDRLLRLQAIAPDPDPPKVSDLKKPRKAE